MWADTVPRIQEAIERYGERVVLTRFVADPAPQGLWAAYYAEYPFAQVPDDELVDLAWREDRILLTRDRHLLRELRPVRALEIRQDAPLAQLRDVLETLASAPPRELFTRCMLDNVPLVVVPDALAWPHLPEGVRGVASPVRQCPECGRFYWNGSHVRRMRHALERALPGWLDAP